jgi:hypothetical protein
MIQGTDDSVELFIDGEPAGFGDFRRGDLVGVRFGYLPDLPVPPGKTRTDDFCAPKVERTPEGFRRLRPEHLRASRPPGRTSVDA